MFGFFLKHTVLVKVVSGMVLLGFLAITAAPLKLDFSIPVANAEVDPPEPPRRLLMRAWEGTGAPPLIFFPSGNEAEGGGGSEVTLAFSKSSVTDISKTGAKATIEWSFTRFLGENWTKCTLYGGIPAREFPADSGSLVLDNAQPGIYLMSCTDGYVSENARVELRVKDANLKQFYCDPSQNSSNRFSWQNYAPGALTPPTPTGSDSSLEDITDTCQISGVGNGQQWDGSLDQIDKEVGWPAASLHSVRTTRVSYKDADTVSVCTTVTATAARYRVGFLTSVITQDGEGGPYYFTALEPFEILREQTADDTKTETSCTDRPLDGAIISTTYPQCSSGQSFGIFTTEYVYHCKANAIAANGKTAACLYEKKTSSFGGIVFSVVLPVLLMFVTPILSFYTALIYVAITTSASVVGAYAAAVAGVTAAAAPSGFVSAMLAVVTTGVANAVMGTVASPDPSLGECDWSRGFSPTTVGAPACTSGCAFDKKTITEGDKVGYPWSFNPSVASFDFSCTGDIGRWSGKVPADAPYSGDAEFAPKQSQSCTLVLKNSAGTSRSYKDAIKVNPLAGGPSCTVSFSPASIDSDKSSVFKWHFSPDTSKVTFTCSGDLGGQTGMQVPQVINYDGEAIVTPRQSQTCSASVSTISGERSSCSGSISVVSETTEPPPPSPAPTETLPVPSLGPPLVSSACTADASSRVSIVWVAGNGSSGYVVDIDNDDIWGNGFWNKGVSSGTTETTAPVGFGGGFGQSGSLNLVSGATYQVRVFYSASGIHSPTANFIAPNCQTSSAPAPQTNTPAPTATETQFAPKLVQTTFTELTDFNSACSSTNAVSASCVSAVHGYCAANGFASGFGPSEMGGNTAFITCLPAGAVSLQNISLGTLKSFHDSCSSADLTSGACQAAYRRYCVGEGFASGLGPNEIGASSVGLTCTKSQSSELRKTSFSELSSYHSGCAVSNATSGACNAAIRRYCIANGFLGGFGPNERGASEAYVTCVKRDAVSESESSLPLWASVLGIFKDFFSIHD